MLVSQQVEPRIPLLDGNGLQLLGGQGNPLFQELPPRIPSEPRDRHESKSPRRVESSSRSRSARRREMLSRDLRAKADAARASLAQANPIGGLPTPELTHEKASNPALLDAQNKLYEELLLLIEKHSALTSFPTVTYGTELST